MKNVEILSDSLRFTCTDYTEVVNCDSGPDLWIATTGKTGVGKSAVETPSWEKCRSCPSSLSVTEIL